MNAQELMTTASEASHECAEYGEHIWMKNGDGSEECPCGTSYFPSDHPVRDTTNA